MIESEIYPSVIVILIVIVYYFGYENKFNYIDKAIFRV